MSILDIFRKKPAGNVRQSRQTTSQTASQSASQSARQASGSRNRLQAGQGGAAYGANPYDTYTWELQTDPDGERQLKRAHLIDKPKPDGESFNPYDTGKFNGGW